MTTRRDFLRSCALGGAGLAGSSLACAAWPARASEPIVRTGRPRFKFSLAAYSYRNLLQGSAPALHMSDFILDCARMELDGTELTSYYFPQPVTPAYLRGLKQQAFRLGLDVSGTAVGNDFGFPAGPERMRQIEEMKRWIDQAEILGAPVIRVFAGHGQPGTSEEETHRLIVAALDECCDYAHQHGIFLALENHGGPTSTIGGLMALVRDVQSPAFGVNLDTGNFHSQDIYADLAQAAPYAVNVQVKVVISGPDGKKQPSDFGRLAAILRDAGYRGYIVLEYEESGDPRTECPKYMAQIREAFA